MYNSAKGKGTSVHIELNCLMATKVFIVDDHYMVIEGIRSLLQNEKNIEWMGHAMQCCDPALLFCISNNPM